MIDRHPLTKVSRCLLKLSKLVSATAVVMALFTTLAGAHFLLNMNVRVFHVDHHRQGLDLYVRMPMPYLVAQLVGEDDADGLPEPAPFTTNRLETDQLVHHVAGRAFNENPNGLGKIAADGLRLNADNRDLVLQVLETRLYPIEQAPLFATLAEAKAAFELPFTSFPETGSVFVGDAVVDLKLTVAAPETIYSYTLSSDLDPELPDQDKTANLILDHAPGGTKVFRERGLLADPVTVSRSTLAAVGTFIKEGVRHILEGLDHVLFVLCLVIGARTFSGLLWRVTGFTIGHSITLSAGFFGFVPKGLWFVPAVETAIALSIVYAAVIVIWPGKRDKSDEKFVFLVTAFIGLLHGLGFSFVLKNILQVTSPDIWQSLLAFNVGVEIGQLAIVTAVWPLLWLLSRTSSNSIVAVRTTIAITCAGIALYWTAERLIGLTATV
jgi:HupE/UreJ protein